MGEPADHFPGVPTDKGRYNSILNNRKPQIF